jgi:hypothetical protein
MLRQSAHEGGKVISPTHCPPLPPRGDPWYLFLLEAESTPGQIVRSERNKRFSFKEDKTAYRLFLCPDSVFVYVATELKFLVRFVN